MSLSHVKRKGRSNTPTCRQIHNAYIQAISNLTTRPKKIKDLAFQNG